MANLTDVSIGTRKLMIIGVFLFIGYLILKTLWGAFVVYYKATHPVAPPPPNVRFGKLPPPKFATSLSTSGMKFTLDNVDGKPPESTNAARVYSMPKKMPTLLAAEKAKAFANKLNFINEPELISSTLYRYTDPVDPLRTLELDITTLNFKLKYDYLKKTEIFTNTNSIQKDQSATEVKNFIQSNNLFDDSIIKGKITSDPLVYDDLIKGFAPASSISTANTVRVNFFRSDIDKWKVLPPQFNKSYNYGLFTPSLLVNSHILEISYTFWPIAFDDFATYPIKTGAQAWQDMTDGYAWVVNLGNNNKNMNVSIRNIYLAYYDNSEPQNYLQPIYVFEGDKNFAAYLPAIPPEWLD